MKYYTLYKVKNTKSKIRGYWLDKGKLYRDNISLVKCKDYQVLKQRVKALFGEGEKAVFYTQGKKGYCIDNKGILTLYHKRLRLRRKRLSIRFFKLLLAYYGGLTCYKLQDKYIIEIFFN